MNEIIEAVNRAAAEAVAQIAAATDRAGLEAVRIAYLGRNGLFPELSKKMGTVPPEERRETGAAFNTGRTKVQAALNEALEKSAGSARKTEAVDLTLPGRRRSCGHRHPITQLTDECVEVFGRMGFIAVDGPEIEDIYKEIFRA